MRSHRKSRSHSSSSATVVAAAANRTSDRVLLHNCYGSSSSNDALRSLTATTAAEAASAVDYLTTTRVATLMAAPMNLVGSATTTTTTTKAAAAPTPAAAATPTNCPDCPLLGNEQDINGGNGGPHGGIGSENHQLLLSARSAATSRTNSSSHEDGYSSVASLLGDWWPHISTSTASNKGAVPVLPRARLMLSPSTSVTHPLAPPTHRGDATSPASQASAQATATEGTLSVLPTVPSSSSSSSSQHAGTVAVTAVREMPGAVAAMGSYRTNDSEPSTPQLDVQLRCQREGPTVTQLPAAFTVANSSPFHFCHPPEEEDGPNHVEAREVPEADVVGAAAVPLTRAPPAALVGLLSSGLEVAPVPSTRSGREEEEESGENTASASAVVEDGCRASGGADAGGERGGGRGPPARTRRVSLASTVSNLFLCEDGTSAATDIDDAPPGLLKYLRGLAASNPLSGDGDKGLHATPTEELSPPSASNEDAAASRAVLPPTKASSGVAVAAALPSAAAAAAPMVCHVPFTPPFRTTTAANATNNKEEEEAGGSDTSAATPVGGESWHESRLLDLLAIEEELSFLSRRGAGGRQYATTTRTTHSNSNVGLSLPPTPTDPQHQQALLLMARRLSRLSESAALPPPRTTAAAVGDSSMRGAKGPVTHATSRAEGGPGIRTGGRPSSPAAASWRASFHVLAAPGGVPPRWREKAAAANKCRKATRHAKHSFVKGKTFPSLPMGASATTAAAAAQVAIALSCFPQNSSSSSARLHSPSTQPSLPSDSRTQLSLHAVTRRLNFASLGEGRRRRRCCGQGVKAECAQDNAEEEEEDGGNSTGSFSRPVYGGEDSGSYAFIGCGLEEDSRYSLSTRTSSQGLGGAARLHPLLPSPPHSPVAGSPRSRDAARRASLLSGMATGAGGGEPQRQRNTTATATVPPSASPALTRHCSTEERGSTSGAGEAGGGALCEERRVPQEEGEPSATAPHPLHSALPKPPSLPVILEVATPVSDGIPHSGSSGTAPTPPSLTVAPASTGAARSQPSVTAFLTSHNPYQHHIGNSSGGLNESYWQRGSLSHMDASLTAGFTVHSSHTSLRAACTATTTLAAAARSYSHHRGNSGSSSSNVSPPAAAAMPTFPSSAPTTALVPTTTTRTPPSQSGGRWGSHRRTLLSQREATAAASLSLTTGDGSGHGVGTGTAAALLSGGVPSCGYGSGGATRTAASHHLTQARPHRAGWEVHEHGIESTSLLCSPDHLASSRVCFPTPESAAADPVQRDWQH